MPEDDPCKKCRAMSPIPRIGIPQSILPVYSIVLQHDPDPSEPMMLHKQEQSAFAIRSTDQIRAGDAEASFAIAPKRRFSAAKP